MNKKIKQVLVIISLAAIAVADLFYIFSRFEILSNEIEAKDAYIAELEEQVALLSQKNADLETELSIVLDENAALHEEIKMLGEMLNDVSSLFGNTPIELTPQEEEELMTVAQAEGESEGIIGKALIMCVVLNRVRDPRYPDNIHDVIFSGAFYVTHDGGRYYTVTPDEECEVALLMVAAGWDGSQGALYFCNDGYNGCSTIPLFRFRRHYFSK